MSTKPIVFLSHASRDREVLTRLREMIVSKTGGSVDVFLSSDGQSVPLGRNWVHALQNALEGARLVLVFLSPNSVHSSWLFFESGFAYSKGIRVVPIGFLGVDLGTLPPPMSLLQGFNIQSAESLDNIIAIINDEFSHRHQERFSDDEFESLQSVAARFDRSLGRHGRLIQDIGVGISSPEHRYLELQDLREDVLSVLAAHSVETAYSTDSVFSFGLSISLNVDAHLNRRGHILVTIDPSVADTALRMVVDLVERVGGIQSSDAVLWVRFDPVVKFLEDRHRFTARIAGSGASLTGDGWVRIGNAEFSFDRQYGQTATVLLVRVNARSTSGDVIRRLVDFVFDRGIVFVAPETQGTTSPSRIPPMSHPMA